MQKFTRPLTREIELGGARLAMTFSEQGLSVRPVGSRKPPTEISWEVLVCHVAGRCAPGATKATADEIAAAVEVLKKGAAPKPAASAEASADPASPPASAAPAAADASPPAPSGSIGPLLSRLEAWLGAQRRRYLDGLLPGASTKERDDFQAGLGIPVPAELSALLAWHNGQSGEFVGHFENNWDLMNTSQIIAAKQELDDGDPAQTGWDTAWIPFLDDDAGDYVCVDSSQPGAPVHEYWQGRQDHPMVAPSLAAWLEQYVRAVEQGAYQEDPERGTFVRRRS